MVNVKLSLPCHFGVLSAAKSDLVGDTECGERDLDLDLDLELAFGEFDR